MKKAKKTTAPKKNPDSARRCCALRLSETDGDDNQAAFARLLGVTPSRWNNLEQGFPLTAQMIRLLIKKVPGLTPCYLLLGTTACMPADLVRRLAKYDKKLKK